MYTFNLLGLNKITRKFVCEQSTPSTDELMTDWTPSTVAGPKKTSVYSQLVVVVSQKEIMFMVV